MMVRSVRYSTADIRPDGAPPAPLDIDDDGAVQFLAPCHDMLCASAQVEVVEGTPTNFVLTVVVSNHPKGLEFENHPSLVTLTASSKITPVYSVAGYLWHGVKLTTVNGENAMAHVYLCAKDSPP